MNVSVDAQTRQIKFLHPVKCLWTFEVEVVFSSSLFLLLF